MPEKDLNGKTYQLPERVTVLDYMRYEQAAIAEREKVTGRMGPVGIAFALMAALVEAELMQIDGKPASREEIEAIPPGEIEAIGEWCAAQITRWRDIPKN